jgi:superfamily II DNA or RNA helicase
VINVYKTHLSLKINSYGLKFRYNKHTQRLKLIEADRVEWHQLKLHLTRHVKGYRFQPRFKLGVWDGTITHFHDGEIELGLWKEAYKLCKLNKWKFEIENKEEFPINRNITLEDVREFCKEFFKDRKLKDGSTFFPYDHQIETAYKILRNRYCLAEVATGGGKSLIFGIVCFYILKRINPKAKFLLVVPNISLVTQFYDDLLDYNNGFVNDNPDPLEIRMCEMMSDKPRRDEGECNIFIGTIQSLEKRDEEFFKQFHVVTTDESHKCGSKSTGQGGKNKTSGLKQVQKVLKKTFGHASMRFGMSGTFPDEETLDFLTIQSLHGPKITEVQAKELQEKGVIAKCKIKAVLMNHNDPGFNDYLTLIKKGGNAKAAYDLEKKYVQESKYRMDFIFDKIISNIKQNTLILFHIKDYGKQIYNRIKNDVPGVDAYYIDGDTKKDKREIIKKKMDSKGKRSKIGMLLGDDSIKDNPKVLVASFGTLSTGVSIKNIHNMIFMESFKSEQIIIQSIGRALRLHKDKEIAIIFDIVDIFDDKTRGKNVLYQHYQERKKFYSKREYPCSELKVRLK